MLQFIVVARLSIYLHLWHFKLFSAGELENVVKQLKDELDLLKDEI